MQSSRQLPVTSKADDPFGTAALRDAVLRAWADSPARLREDANAEELLSVGYADRVLFELAANAADAARLSGGNGRCRIDLVDGELRVANTGVALDAAGVAALASLRASAKRDGASVGHFGVGFSAIRSLTDDVEVRSSRGGICFSASKTRAAIDGLHVAGLSEEVERRGGVVPALRLPWPLAPDADTDNAVGAHAGVETNGVPDGFVTEVRCRLRDAAAQATVADQVTPEAATYLLWALPGLFEISVPGWRIQRSSYRTGLVTVTSTVDPRLAAERVDVGSVQHSRVITSSGVVPPKLLADSPVEQRGRTTWQLAWIVPVDDAGSPQPPPSSVVGAPTPTDDELGMPARLVASFPVDENRTRVAHTALTDFLVEQAGLAYRELVMACAPVDRVRLVPQPGFPAGPLDGALREAVSRELATMAFLPAADGTTIRPDHAVIATGIAGRAATVIASAVPGLLPWPTRAAEVSQLRSLGVRVVDVAEILEQLASLTRPVAEWQVIYDALESTGADDLAGLPVPAPDGATIIGARGLLLPAPGALPAGLLARLCAAAPGLKVADPGAAHPLLRRLGAVDADAGQILDSPALRHEIGRRLADLDEYDPDPDDAHRFADLMVTLVAAVVEPTEYDGTNAPSMQMDAAARSALGDVLLTDTDGEYWPAAALLLPDSPLADVLADDADLAVIGTDWIDRYGRQALAAMGVRSVFAVRHFAAPPTDTTDLADAQVWWDEAGSQRPPRHCDSAGETFAAVTDLDLVDDEQWASALTLLIADDDCRDALRPSHGVTSYTSWWLQRFARIRGELLGRFRRSDAVDLAALYDELPVALPPAVQADLELVETLADAARDAPMLCSRWADPSRTIPSAQVPRVTAAVVQALISAADEDDMPPLPAGVRVLTGAVVDAEEAAVLDRPDLAQVFAPGMLVAGGANPVTVADLLDLPLASQMATIEVRKGADAVQMTLGEIPGATGPLSMPGMPDITAVPVTLAAELAVVVRSPRAAGLDEAAGPVRVTWWLTGTGVAIDGSAAGIGRAVAHLAGQWAERYRLVAMAAQASSDIAETGIG